MPAELSNGGDWQVHDPRGKIRTGGHGDQPSVTSRTTPVFSIAGIQNLASTGITSRLQIGDSSMPPTMTQASGCCTCEPIPVEIAAGTSPMHADRPNSEMNPTAADTLKFRSAM